MDKRDYAHININNYIKHRDANKWQVTIEFDDYEEEHSMVFPFEYEVCHECDGRGSYVNPDIDRNGISSHEFYEDPEFANYYFSGAYDVECAGCMGMRVQPKVITDELTDEQKQFLEDLDDKLEADYEFARIQEWERRMGY